MSSLTEIRQGFILLCNVTWSLYHKTKSLDLHGFDADCELFTVHIEEGAPRYQFNLKTGQHWKQYELFLFVQPGKK